MTDEMATVVVSGFGSQITHVVTVPAAAMEAMAWPSERYPFTGMRTPVVARCGSRVRSCQPCVVVMKPGAPVRCKHCERATGISKQPETAAA